MNFDFFVFPAPKCKYNPTILGNELIFLPKFSKISLNSRDYKLPKSSTFSKHALNNENGNSFMYYKQNFMKQNIAKKSNPKAFHEDDEIFEGEEFENRTQFGLKDIKLNIKTAMPSLEKKKLNENVPKININHSKFNTKNKIIEKKTSKSPFSEEISIGETKSSPILEMSPPIFERKINQEKKKETKHYFDENYEKDFDEYEGDNNIELRSPRNIRFYSSINLLEKKTIIKTSNKKQELKNLERYVPCLLLEPDEITNKILIYFHGNAEDIYYSYDLLSYIRNYFQIRVLAVEYPGYGIYRTHNSNADLIEEDSLYVFDYLTEIVGYLSSNIIVFGRSIGSGPATYVASNRNPGALILLSPFTSLRAVVKEHLGFLENIIKDRFNNYENIKKCKCPCLFIHGIMDRLISYQHSKKLCEASKGNSELVLPKEMTHSEFFFETDFILPLEKFLISKGFDFCEENIEEKLLFPSIVYETPRLFNTCK